MKYQIKSTNQVIVADLAFVETHYANDFVEIVEDVQVTPSKRTLTKLEYMNRFTDVELAAIYTAAKAVVQVEIWLEKFKLAQEISLDDVSTVGGLQAMEAAGLIGTGRAAEILA